MIEAEVMSWPDVARVAVFDELLGNDDRHINNLVRRGPRDFLPIVGGLRPNYSSTHVARSTAIRYGHRAH
jgi:hypothetical protein